MAPQNITAPTTSQAKLKIEYRMTTQKKQQLTDTVPPALSCDTKNITSRTQITTKTNMPSFAYPSTKSQVDIGNPTETGIKYTQN